jgi:hypothetical protein
MSINLKPDSKVNILPGPSRGGASDKTISVIVKSIITNQLALFYNEKIKGTKYYKRELKRDVNIVLKTLLKAEAIEFDSFLENLSGQVDWLQDLQFDMVEELGELEPDNFPEVTELLKAYKKHTKSMLGIARKINKQAYGT